MKLITALTCRHSCNTFLDRTDAFLTNWQDFKISVAVNIGSSIILNEQPLPLSH
jgi:hypothetical protein